MGYFELALSWNERRRVAAAARHVIQAAMADAPLRSPVRENHRVRVGRERTGRMRARLLDTILATYRGDQMRGPAVLDDLLACANVSKGTFYEHFASLEAAVIALGDQLAEEMSTAIVLNYEQVDRLRDRLAIGFQPFLARAAMDARWRTFVTHGRFLNPAPDCRDQGRL